MTEQLDTKAGLDAVINEQVRLLVQLNTTLLEEHAAIAARDVDLLTRKSEEKLVAIRTLSELEARRREFASESEAGSSDRFTEIRRLTEKCRVQNSANDALLRAERRFVDGLLSILRSGTLATNTYSKGADLNQSVTRRLPLASA